MQLRQEMLKIGRDTLALVVLVLMLKCKYIMIRNKMFRSKYNTLEEFGVIKLIAQAINPVTGGYSIEFAAERYGNVFVFNPRSEKRAGISV